MSNKKLPENATKTEGPELARRGRGEISTATAVPHVSYDDLRHADRIVIDGLCLLYTSPSPPDLSTSRMPSSA